MKTQVMLVAVMNINRRIHREEYYERQWRAALVKNNMSTASIEQGAHTDQQLWQVCEDMWEALPDTPSIRRGVFFEICEVAQGDYGFGIEE